MPRKSEKEKLITALCENYLCDVIMLETSDEEEEDDINENFRLNMISVLLNRRCVQLGVPKTSSGQREVLRQYDNNKYSQMICVCPEEFACIMDLIKDDDVFKTSSCEAQLPIDLQLTIVLYRLGSSGDGACVRKIAALFGIGDGGTIQNVTKRVFKSILNLKERYLYWPNKIERSQLVLATTNEMPGCVGYIDSSEIKLAEAPGTNREQYWSHKQQYVVKIQAVCDYKLRIRQLTVGYKGSMHDAKIFKDCPIAKHPERFLSSSQWIAGGSTYPLKTFLLTPYKLNSTEHTTDVRQEFNRYFSKYHVRIENCFRLLKEKFGSLKELRFRMITKKNQKECNDWIVVCCILHNILLNLKYRDSDYVVSNTNLTQSTNSRTTLLNFIQNQRSSHN